jgi:hypothetical protein
MVTGMTRVDFIWWRTCAGRSVIGVEDATLHREITSLHCIGISDPLEPGIVVHLRGFAFDDQVEVTLVAQSVSRSSII